MIGVRVTPGATALTLIPCGASSAADTRVRALMPAFEAAYTDGVAKPWKAALELDIHDATTASSLDHVAADLAVRTNGAWRLMAITVWKVSSETSITR